MSSDVRVPFRYLGQGLLYAVFALLVGGLSDWPVYAPYGPDQAMIKLSLSHPGQHKETCRRLTPEELAKLPPNMRVARKCSRERWPVKIELRLDGQVTFSALQPPAGLAGDGASSVYRVFAVPAGRHRVAVAIGERGPAEGFDHEAESEVTLAPAQILVVSLRAGTKSFSIR